MAQNGMPDDGRNLRRCELVHDICPADLITLPEPVCIPTPVRIAMTAPAKSAFGVVDEEIEDLQAVVIFCGAGLAIALCLLL
jgi:hypothetical protein